MRNQYLSRPDVKEYLSKYPDVTKEEKRELLKWLKMGYSPYSNDLNVFDENDRLTDFIDAMRAFDDWCNEQWSILSTPDTERVTFCPPAEQPGTGV